MVDGRTCRLACRVLPDQLLLWSRINLHGLKVAQSILRNSHEQLRSSDRPQGLACLSLAFLGCSLGNETYCFEIAYERLAFAALDCKVVPIHQWTFCASSFLPADLLSAMDLQRAQMNTKIDEVLRARTHSWPSRLPDVHSVARPLRNLSVEGLPLKLDVQLRLEWPAREHF